MQDQGEPLLHRHRVAGRGDPAAPGRLVRRHVDDLGHPDGEMSASRPSARPTGSEYTPSSCHATSSSRRRSASSAAHASPYIATSSARSLLGALLRPHTCFLPSLPTIYTFAGLTGYTFAGLTGSGRGRSPHVNVNTPAARIVVGVDESPSSRRPAQPVGPAPVVEPGLDAGLELDLAADAADGPHDAPPVRRHVRRSIGMRSTTSAMADSEDGGVRYVLLTRHRPAMAGPLGGGESPGRLGDRRGWRGFGPAAPRAGSRIRAAGVDRRPRHRLLHVRARGR
jgi:hypothetical protein